MYSPDERPRGYDNLNDEQRSWIDILFLKPEDEIISALAKKIDDMGDKFSPADFNPYPSGWANPPGSSDFSLMNIAASHGNLEVLKFLENKVDSYISEKRKVKKAPVENSDFDRDDFWIRWEIDNHVTRSNPMAYAIKAGQENIIDYLIKKPPMFLKSSKESTRILMGREVFFAVLNTGNFNLLGDIIKNQWFDPGYVSSSLGGSYLAFFLKHVRKDSEDRLELNEIKELILTFLKNSSQVKISLTEYEGFFKEKKLTESGFIEKYIPKSFKNWLTQALENERTARKQFLNFILKNESQMTFEQALQTANSRHFLLNDKDLLSGLTEKEKEKIQYEINHADTVLAGIIRTSINKTLFPNIKSSSPTLSADQMRESIKNLSQEQFLEILTYLYSTRDLDKTEEARFNLIFKYFPQPKTGNLNLGEEEIQPLDLDDSESSKNIFDLSEADFQKFLAENMPEARENLTRFFLDNVEKTYVATMRESSGDLLFSAKPDVEKPSFGTGVLVEDARPVKATLAKVTRHDDDIVELFLDIKPEKRHKDILNSAITAYLESRLKIPGLESEEKLIENLKNILNSEKIKGNAKIKGECLEIIDRLDGNNLKTQIQDTERLTKEKGLSPNIRQYSELIADIVDWIGQRYKTVKREATREKLLERGVSDIELIMPETVAKKPRRH